MHTQSGLPVPPFCFAFKLQRLTIRFSCFNDTTNLSVCEIRLFEDRIKIFYDHSPLFSGFLCLFTKETSSEIINLTNRRLTLLLQIVIIGKVNQIY